VTDPERDDVSWSVLVQRLGDATVVLDKDSETVLATASIGKILLLLTVAQLMHLPDVEFPDGPDGFGDQMLDRREVLAVADSGIWQHLKSDRLPLHDVAALVGATSDNWATNALIERVGLPTVSDTATRLGLQTTALHDFVRDERTCEQPPHLSSSNAADLVTLVSAIHSGTGMDPSTSQRVQKWLSINTDLSMVAAAFGLDPLAHADADRGLRLWNKTGTNVGVRCDVGLLQTSNNAVAYAVLANWTPADSLDLTRDDVLSQMRGIGELVLQAARSTG
jgi:beta-lactamase class A